MAQRRNPAVVAGLAGAIALALPETARALPAIDLSALDVTALDGAFPSQTLAFAAGLAGGALACGLVVGAVSLARRARSRSRSADGGEVPTGAPAPDGGDAPAHAPRHMRAEAPVAQAEGTPEPEPAPEPDPDSAPAPRDGAPAAGGHAARDYEQIAENYVRRASFRERMARRAQGVAATLKERLDAGRMEGVPVIARADGSVGDVGTSWWEDTVGRDAIIADSGFADDVPAIPSDFSAPLPAPRAATAASPATPAVAAAGAAPRVARPDASSISSRVAFVEEGVYPEHRTVDDLSEDDEWAAALRSLDERFAAEASAQAAEARGFQDVVGGADTLDEPDNLEPDTSFIPFRTPAGHPEVVDTETYVDYLIKDEFSKNSSPVARRSSKRFLRVLEGGTGTAPRSSRHLSREAPSRTGAARAPKHFAAPRAAEA